MLTLIVAVDRNRAIGRDGELPWHQSTDLRRFKKLTIGATIVMGRATFDSIGRPLPGRRNIVLSRNPEWQVEGVEKMSMEKVLDIVDSKAVTIAADDARDGGQKAQIFIIGGGQIYESFMPHADAIEMTKIHTEVEDADTWFPENPGFIESSRLECPAGEGDDHAMTFIRLERE
jgi:dihydrofolate reductase